METVREGSVEVRVPAGQAAGITEQVFYNPVQELNRDITVAVLDAYRTRHPGVTTYIDAMTATGIRGLRAAASGWTVTCLDVDPEAVELCRSNFRRNDLTGTVRHRSANVDLHQHRYDVTDIDPFGSPMPYIDAAFRGTRRLLCVTATDTAPLCGAHKQSGIRRYGAVPQNTEYHAEMGVRVLLSALARAGARYDTAVTPLLTHATRHYVRTYLELTHRATDANATLEELGFVHHCPDCLHRTHEAGLLPHLPDDCHGCGGTNLLTAGPLWIGPTRDPGFTAETRDHLTPEMQTVERARKLLTTIEQELDTPTHYDQHRLCERWSRSANPMAEFLRAVRAGGYAATRTHYGGTTLKTDADVRSIRELTA